MEEEPRELEIQLEPENFFISPVTSVNGQTGDVVLKTSDLENDSNYQNATEVSNAIGIHNQSSSAHQDIRQAITDEQTARVNADNSLQGQIDAITSASDVVDIVGTYADLQAYDTQHLKDNDVIKVLQDETHNDAMTYYRWDKETETWTYIGAEGPYYTKSETNTLLNDKLDVSAVPDNFFDGPATVSDSGTSIELSEAIKFKDIELLGDSVQQTYTGKNLFNKDATINYTYGTSCSAIDTGVRITRTSSTVYTVYTRFMFNVENYVGQTITLSANASASALNTPRINIGTCDSNGSNRVEKDSQQGTGTLTVSYTIEAGDQYIYINFYANYASQNVQVGDYADYDNAQLELSATPTSYEPYVGGMPSPNPGYPQTVQTVTGTQTITITDGDVQNTYTVDLGSIELCKIGEKQDYIYKSGDNWYLHKECGGVTYTGSAGENWDLYSGGSSVFRIRILDMKGQDNQQQIAPLLCNYYTPTAYAEIINPSYWPDYGIAGRVTSSSGIAVRNKDCADVSAFKTWLTTHNTSVYYILATSTDTKITNSTLIGQLNTLFNASLYQPTTTISSAGTLPAILNVEAFTDNLNSLIEIASEPDENVFVGTNGAVAGASGLVPAPQTTDAGKFLKADGTWASAGGGGGGSYTAGTGIDITSDVISVDTDVIQEKLSAGSNVSISNSNVISATDTTYTAGTNVNISAQNVISATDTTYTAGNNVSISAQNVISATDTTYSDFTGTDGNTGGTAGLVPAPTTSDTDKFLKSDGTWATAGGGGGGGSTNCKELTSADYNYPTNNPTTVALWLLEPGLYWWDYNFADGGGITFTTSSSGSLTNNKLLPYSQQVIIGYYGGANSGFHKIQAFNRGGLMQDSNYGWAPFVPYIINTSNGNVVNFQTSAIPVGRGDVNL